jgi:hypothetical protein
MHGERLDPGTAQAAVGSDSTVYSPDGYDWAADGPDESSDFHNPAVLVRMTLRADGGSGS